MQALGTRSAAGGVRLLATRKFVWRPSVVSYLIEVLDEEERAKALRPVPEEIERLYADQRLSLSGMHPHIAKIEMSTRLDFPQDRKQPERKPSEREAFRREMGV